MDGNRTPSGQPDAGTRTRIDAIRILARWEETGEFPDRMLGDVPAFRRGFVMDLVYTTVRNARALAFAVDGLVRTRKQGNRRRTKGNALFHGESVSFSVPLAQGESDSGW